MALDYELSFFISELSLTKSQILQTELDLQIYMKFRLTLACPITISLLHSSKRKLWNCNVHLLSTI